MSNTSGMALYTYFPRYLEAINTNISLIPIIISIFALTSVIFPSFIGKHSDKIQNRKLYGILGGVGMLVSFLLLPLTTNLFLIIAILFLYGFSTAAAAMLFVLFAEIVENDKHYISIYQASIALGWFFGAFFCGIFVDLFGIMNFFWFLIFFIVLNLILVLFTTEDRTLIIKRSELREEIEDMEALVELSEQEDIVSKSIYPALLFRNFGIRPVLSIIAIFMALHLNSDTEIGFLIGFNPLIQLVLILVVGNFVTEKTVKSFMVIGYILSGVTLLGYVLSTDFWGFLLCQILISLSYSLFWTATQVYITKNTTPLNKGKYIGYANTAFYMGSFFGALLFSLLISLLSNYYNAMIFMIIFPILSAISILIGFKESFQDPSSTLEGVMS